MRTRRLLLVLSSAALSLGLCVALFEALRVRPEPAIVLPPASSVLPAGAAAPLSFELARLGGGPPVSLRELVTGRLTVVNFFASWCTACASELSAFGEVSQRFAHSVAFVGIDTEDSDHALALSLLRRGAIGYPVALDSANDTVSTAYGIIGLPTTFFLNRSGHVVAEVLGAEDTAALTSRLLALEHSTPR